MSRKTLAAVAMGAALLAPTVAHAEINIGISVSPPVVVAPAPPVVVAPQPTVVIAPPPPVVVASPPQIVAIPGSGVYYAPGVSYNLFVYHGRYYSFHDGMWFVAGGPGGWTMIAGEAVPAPVLAVPVTYYRVPPGHAKMGGHHGHGERGCPPGLAKHGRC